LRTLFNVDYTHGGQCSSWLQKGVCELQSAQRPSAAQLEAINSYPFEASPIMSDSDGGNKIDLDCNETMYLMSGSAGADWDE
jgi:hypothetical protein